jgi:hypothetical protein
MVLKCSVVGLVAAALVITLGCERGESDKRLIDIVVKLERQGTEVNRIAGAMERIGERLDEIQASLEGNLHGPRGRGLVEGDDKAAASNLVSLKQYRDIMAQIAVLQSQLISLEEEIVRLRQEETEVRKRDARQALRDRGAAWRAMGEPDELCRRLDILVNDFSEKIDDPAAREQFAADIEEMKSVYSTPLSLEQRRQQARSLIVEAIDTSPDEGARTWLQEQLTSLDESTNPLELGVRVNVTLQLQRMREVGELARKHNIPEVVLTDSGLLFFPAGGSLAPQQ